MPTSDKPQSKLWFNDGRWWASLYNEASTRYHIYWLDLSNPLDQKWIDTGTDLDTRPQTMADILWDNTAKKLYLVSGGPSLDAWFMRYSYNPATKLYARDFNPVVVRSGGSETIALDKDLDRQAVGHIHPGQQSVCQSQHHQRLSLGAAICDARCAPARHSLWRRYFVAGRLS